MRGDGLAVCLFVGGALLASRPAHAQVPETAADLERIRQRLDASSPLRDTVDTSAQPTFRISISEEAVDIRRFWGEPDAVSSRVRPSGGPWHHEFKDMVTPDAFKGYGAIFTNSEKASIAGQQLASALVFKYLPGAIAAAVRTTRERAAKQEVQAALEEFYVTHPGTRPATADARLP
jgi:hypothetical protein